MKIYVDIDYNEFEMLFRTIANNVKYYRKLKGFTQEELALSMGHSSASMLSKIEAGLENKHFNIKQLYSISKILNVSISAFFVHRVDNPIE